MWGSNFSTVSTCFKKSFHKSESTSIGWIFCPFILRCSLLGKNYNLNWFYSFKGIIFKFWLKLPMTIRSLWSVIFNLSSPHFLVPWKSFMKLQIIMAKNFLTWIVNKHLSHILFQKIKKIFLPALIFLKDFTAAKRPNRGWKLAT